MECKWFQPHLIQMGLKLKYSKREFMAIFISNSSGGLSFVIVSAPD